MARTFHRVIIAFIFLSLNALLLTGVYFAFIKTPETCTDGKQNQNEQGIDCGGVCSTVCHEVVVGQDIQIEEVSFVADSNNRYDIVGRIMNPNQGIGATGFTYTFELKDSSGAVVATRMGKSYALPQETKSLIELNLEARALPQTATLKITDTTWERALGYREKPAVNIYQKRYGAVTDGFGFSKAAGTLSNESPYDFRSIVVGVILRDGSGRLLALNKTTQNNIRAGESRDFEIVWPTPFPGAVERVDMEIDTDIYHSENFVKQYFPGGGY
jgi:hypothetical protein